jgi:hypothetical protein
MEVPVRIERRYFSAVRRVTVCMVLVLLVTTSACLGQQDRVKGTADSVGEFVRGFYASYRMLVESQPVANPPVWVQVARSHDSVLTSALALALSTDRQEAVAFPGVIAGLDFDPFLGAQDPCDNYSIGRIVAQQPGFRAEIHGDCGGGQDAVPDVIAEIVPVNTAYRFTNFYYPRSSTDLRSLLTRLRDARQEDP